MMHNTMRDMCSNSQFKRVGHVFDVTMGRNVTLEA